MILVNNLAFVVLQVSVTCGLNYSNTNFNGMSISVIQSAINVGYLRYKVPRGCAAMSQFLKREVRLKSTEILPQYNDHRWTQV